MKLRKIRIIWMRMRKENEKGDIQKDENEKGEIEKDENEKDELEKDEIEKVRKLDNIRMKSLAKLSFYNVTTFVLSQCVLHQHIFSILVHYFQVSVLNSWRQGYASIGSIVPCTKI